MTAQRNKQIAQDFFHTLARRFRGEDVDLTPFLDEGIVWHLPQSVESQFGVPATIRGRTQAAEILAGIGNVYRPDSTTFTYHTWVAEGDAVALHFSLQAQTAAGKQYDNHYQSVMHFRDGLITEMRETFDTACLASLFQE